jgi:hypothetical protein
LYDAPYLVNYFLIPRLSLNAWYKVKAKLPCNNSQRGTRGWNVRPLLLLWHSAQTGRQRYQHHAPAVLIPQVNSWYSFLLHAECTLGLMHVDTRINQVYKFTTILSHTM